MFFVNEFTTDNKDTWLIMLVPNNIISSVKHILNTVNGTKNKYKDFCIIWSVGISILILDLWYTKNNNKTYSIKTIKDCQLVKKFTTFSLLDVWIAKSIDEDAAKHIHQSI